MATASSIHEPFHPFRGGQAARRAAGACAFVLAAVACSREPDAPPAVATQPAVEAYDAYQDDRIAQWMSGCAHTDPFLEDTSDPIPVMVSKLAAGQLDPLRAARSELSAYGASALPELQRLFEQSYSEPFLAQRVQNVIEVVGAMDTDAGRDMLLKALDHPQQTIRDAAARALVRHARPEDYDRLAAALPRSGLEAEPDFVLAMLAADRPRLERDFVEWLRTGRMLGATRLLATKVGDTRDPEIRAALRPVYRKLEGEVRIHVQAIVAAEPDEEALSELRTWLADESQPSRRHVVAQALARVGLARELRHIVAKHDPDEALRKIAVQAIAAAPPDDEALAVLRAALNDVSPVVREAALGALAERADPMAIDLALHAFLGSRQELEAALRALRAPMSKDPALAQRVLEALQALRRDEAGRGLVDERTLVRAVGQVPLESAARIVMEIGQRARGAVQGVPAHRWHALAAGNSGSAGLAYIRSLWATEADPVRRMDLVMAGTFERSPATRQFLSEVVASERATPPEVLHAADRLAQFGPARDVAPLLKRVALRMNDKRVRPAFNCLLWTWYGRST